VNNDPAVLYEHHGRTAVLSLNRPDERNAWGRELVMGLLDAVARLGDDEKSRVGVLTGRGTCFSSGANLKDPATHATEHVGEYTEGQDNSLYDALMRCPKPVIAAVNGAAHGAGATLMVACDLRFFSTEAYAVWPMAKLGIMPANGTMVRLARVVGAGHALELTLTAKKLDAEEASRIGLANQVLPPDQLMPVALETAERMASYAPLSLRFIKESLYRGLDMGLHDSIHAERYRQFILYNTRDRREASQAWLEKRKPEFTGE
jgi:2-(1,2-epoxy-1,2-dihydrophenyl)acetyl-CoA isomerase